MNWKTELSELLKGERNVLLRDSLKSRARKFSLDEFDIVGTEKYRIVDASNQKLLFPARFYGEDFIRAPDVHDPKTEYYDEGLDHDLLLNIIKDCIVGRNDLIIPIKFAETIANNAVYLFNPTHPERHEIIREELLTGKRYAIVGVNLKGSTHAILKDLETGNHYRMKFHYDPSSNEIDFRWYLGFFADCVVCEPVKVKKKTIEIIEVDEQT